MQQDIAGSVEGGSLAKALATVMTRRVGSVVVISDGTSFRQFDFGVSYVRCTSLGPRRRATMVEIVRELDLIKPEELAGLVHFAHGDDREFARLAVKHGFLGEPQYEQALRRQLEEDLLDVYLWRGAEVRLLKQEPPAELGQDGFLLGRLKCPVHTFLSRTRVRVEEFRDDQGQLPNGREVYESVRLAHLPEGVDLTGMEELLKLLDGTRTVVQAIELARVRWVAAHRFMTKALSKGLLRRAAPRVAREVARAHLESDVVQLEDALARSPAPAIVRLRLAKSYEQLAAPLRAAEHWKLLGRYWHRREALDTALEAYRHCIRLVPEDVATREAVIEIHRTTGNVRDLIAEGRPLAEMLFKYNLLKRATVLLLQLLEVQQSDLGLRRQLIKVLLGLGARQLALKHLRILARELENSVASEHELRDVYLQIGALDHADIRSREKLDRLFGISAQKRTIWITAGGAAACVLLAFSWFRYEFGARLNVQSAMDQARQYMIEGRYQLAAESLTHALRANRFATGTTEAERLLDHSHSVLDKQKQLRDLAASQRDPAVERSKASAAGLATDARAALETGDRDRAHRAYVALFDLYPWYRGDAAPLIPLAVDVEPRDARVLLDGVEVGTGSTELAYSPHKKSVLRVERPGFAPAERVLDHVLDERIDMRLGRPELWRFCAHGTGAESPLVHEPAVWLATRDGRVVELDACDGEVLRVLRLGLYVDLSRRPVHTPSGVVVVTSSGEALNFADGAAEASWSWSVDSPLQPLPLEDGGVAIPCADGSIAALSHGTGAVDWTIAPGTVATGRPSLRADGTLLFVNQARALGLASQKSGEIRWLGDGTLGLEGTPVSTEAHAFALTQRGALRVVDVATGVLLHDVRPPYRPAFDPVADEEAVFLVSAEGQIMSYGGDGKPRFRPATLGARPSTAPATRAGRLYIPTDDGVLHVLDARTGEHLWRQQIGARVVAAPTFGFQTAYVVTTAGDLVALTD